MKRLFASIVFVALSLGCAPSARNSLLAPPTVGTARLPVLTLTATPVTGTSPLTVTFAATCSTCITFTWNFGESGTATGPNQKYVYQSGTYYPVVVATDENGNAATATVIIMAGSTGETVDNDNIYCAQGDIVIGAATDGPANLPENCINSSLANTPSPGKVVPLTAGGNLQTAYDDLLCGQTLVLAHHAVWQGSNLHLAAKGCDDKHWITITSDGVLPVPGNRANPLYLSQMAAISMKSRAQPVFLTGDHIRFIGIAWLKAIGGAPLVRFVDPVGASNIVFDRNYVHGNPGEETRRFISLSGASKMAFVENWIDEMHCIARTGTCTDAQAISGGGGSTPNGTYKIVNNYLSASTENILFGGSTATTTPCDIEVRGNYLYKPVSWNPLDRHYALPTYTVKNLFELKNACRVLLEGNVMANTWGGFSQVGAGILITPKNQASGVAGVCPLCFTSDVIVRYNYVTTVGQALLIANAPDHNHYWSAGGHGYSIHDDVFDNLGYSTCYACAKNITHLSSDYSTATPPTVGEIIHDVALNHLTLITARTWPATDTRGEDGMLNMSGPPARNTTGTPQILNVTFENSIFAAGNSGFYPTGGGVDNCSTGGPSKNVSLATMISNCWVGKSSFSGNLAVAYTGLAVWPSGNQLPASWAMVGFVNYNNGSGGDYRLTNGSPYKNAAMDGTDPGANIDLVLKYTENAISGVRYY
jgi:hypothetical protein